MHVIFTDMCSLEGLLDVYWGYWERYGIAFCGGVQHY